MRRVEALEVATRFEAFMEEVMADLSIKGRLLRAGALRRKMETLEELRYLLALEGAPSRSGLNPETQKSLLEKVEVFRSKLKKSLPILVEMNGIDDLGRVWFKATGPEAHVSQVLGRLTDSSSNFDQEETLYAAAGLPYLSPELREWDESLELTPSILKELPHDRAVQGVFHNHTQWSDGVHSLEQMVEETRRLGLSYLGISDHSQSAVYAQGVKTAQLNEQRKEVQEVQEKFPSIRIFWGTESDIRKDGSLDYPETNLLDFDFVIASIHTRYRNDREAMTDRLIEAIRHPCTTFLGHPTGRLLLGRDGYDLDMDRVLKEAAAHEVVMEINGNPARLDLDWRWGGLIRKHQVLVSLNPDAHRKEGLGDYRHGVTVARKGLIPRELILNTWPLERVDAFLTDKKIKARKALGK